MTSASQMTSLSGEIFILKEGKGLQIMVIYWTPFQVKEQKTEGCCLTS